MQNPKILFLDLELSPNEGGFWGPKWEQRILYVTKYSQVLSFAWKWLGQKTVQCLSMRDQQSDKKLVVQLRDICDEADVIVWHNGDAFDGKKLNARLTHHEKKPAKIWSSVDTKKIAKRHFGFISNSLDDLGHYLGLGRKMKHQGIELWLGCMAGEAECWRTMIEYNKQDVVLLEKVYLRLLPWIQNHPNMAKFFEGFGCPNCGSDEVMKRGIRANRAGLRQQYLCRKCGSWYLDKTLKEFIS